MESACRAAKGQADSGSRDAGDDLPAAAGNSSRNLRDCGSRDRRRLAGCTLSHRCRHRGRQAAPRCRATRRPDRQPSVPADRSGCARDRARQARGSEGVGVPGGRKGREVGRRRRRDNDTSRRGGGGHEGCWRGRSRATREGLRGIRMDRLAVGGKSAARRCVRRGGLEGKKGRREARRQGRSARGCRASRKNEYSPKSFRDRRHCTTGELFFFFSSPDRDTIDDPRRRRYSRRFFFSLSPVFLSRFYFAS